MKIADSSSSVPLVERMRALAHVPLLASVSPAKSVAVHPVFNGIIVAGLARTEWLVEVEATAVIPKPAE